MKISYNAMIQNTKLTEFDNQAMSKETRRDGEKQMKTKLEEIAQPENNISWDEAISGEKFITLDQDKRKVLVIKNWKIQRVDKWGEPQIEFYAEVLEEDNQECEKAWTSTSKRLMRKLKPFLSEKNPEKEVRISIKKLGDRFDTTYDVEEMA